MSICRDGQLAAVCEQERVTRVRGVGVRQGGFPDAALALALRAAGLRHGDVDSCSSAEDGIAPDGSAHNHQFDYRRAHAAAAFRTSPFPDALTIVCDRHASPELSAWRGDSEQPLDEEAPAFATLYAGLARGLGFASSGDEHLIESLARIGDGNAVDRAAAVIGYDGDRLAPSSDYVARIDAWKREDEAIAHTARIASSVQRVIAAALVQVLRTVKAAHPATNVCLTGSLFYNSYFNTAVRESGLFDDAFVPVNPGEPGVSAGCAMLAGDGARGAGAREAASPFLGPAYSAEDIKAVLDNCKLVYHYENDRAIEQRTADALARGQLVGWFQGRMEWGSRALGNRSILANPFAPHVLENLNRFLKQRESYRAYGVSVAAADQRRYFTGPASSEFMQYEFDVTDPELFRHLLVAPRARIRVHTVADRADAETKRYLRVLAAFGERSGTPVVVNTSFNGFHEPIVCSPRDAVRVFYGSGIDMLVMGNFVLQK